MASEADMTEVVHAAQSVEADRCRAYPGNHTTMTGNHIDYVDDTGFTADGEFVDRLLYHAVMALYREH